MDGQSQAAVQRERELQFLEVMHAFMSRNFSVLEAWWRPDVVMTLPGSSWEAGIHKGYSEVGRCVLGLRQVLASEEKQITFLHEGDQMIVGHKITVSGPMHVVEMTLLLKVTYDPDGRAAALDLDPDDLPLFDHVLNTALRNQSTA